ncbi:MAG: carbohydrate ABC transporter permease [Lachnospiraceae bacterium]
MAKNNEQIEEVKIKKTPVSTDVKVKRAIIAVIKYAILIFTAALILLPLVVVFLGSFKGHEEFLTSGVFDLPKVWNFDNYVQAFVDGKMALGFKNTIIILAVSIIATVLTGTMTAYVVNRFKFPGRGIINNLFLIASLIPSITMQMSVFQIISNMGLFNTRWSTILLFAGTDIISIYIFLQFLENISYSLDESAIMDGASYFMVYRKIILPLLKPAIVTVVIIKGVGFYNEFYTPYLYMPSADLAMISTALYKFTGPYGSQWEIICAGIIITLLPTLIIFLALQRQIYAGMTQGSVKE